ncbi:Nif11-like leader peptide family natural product precursor [Ramlibacter terrae]|uniref:Nif11-like leader peptide family natural product n=1 Tax=Ramlibacter terrae TaxID=2732511 RepID=A0ABX6P103_9BURK|nr:Nif11-like leader peptide family natural product precursor [Ramlibacter terrae]
MSLEAVNAYRAALTTDPALQESARLAVAANDPQQVVQAAAAQGFTFTVGELRAALTDSELSDSELELVAGGGQIGCQTGKPTYDGSDR